MAFGTITSGIHYGIDLGTTHTIVIKISMDDDYRWQYDKIELPNYPVDRSMPVKKTRLLPSVVYNGQDHVVVGEYAKEAIEYDPLRVTLNPKIDLGGYIASDEEENFALSAQESSKEILKVCFRAIQNDCGPGVKADVCISVPAAFSQDKIRETEEAAQLALRETGLDQTIHFRNHIEEPYAAFTYLARCEKSFAGMLDSDKPERKVMLIDIGGGTMDIVIRTLTTGKRKVLYIKDLYRAAQMDEFAGVRFDRELMIHLMQEMWDFYQIKEGELDQRDQEIIEKKMQIYAEEAKKFLCNPQNAGKKFEYTVSFKEIPGSLRKPFVISLDKRRMDSIFVELMEPRDRSKKSIRKILEDTLVNNELQPKDIDSIFLTGGMAIYDKIAETIRRFLGKEVIVASDPLFCTAMGVAASMVTLPEIERAVAAEQEAAPAKTDSAPQTGSEETQKETAAQASATAETAAEPDKTATTKALEKPQEDPEKTVSLRMQDIVIGAQTTMGISFFIDVEGSLPIEIISDKEEFPCDMRRVNHKFKTSSQKGMNIILYEGYSAKNCGLRVLKQKTITFPKMKEVGTEVDIYYSIDSNKIITIYAAVPDEQPYVFSTME